jgi:hypothetical protein
MSIYEYDLPEIEQHNLNDIDYDINYNFKDYNNEEEN